MGRLRTMFLAHLALAKMSLYDHRLSLSSASLLSVLLLLSVDTAPDHMLYHRDSKFCTHNNIGLMIMLMKNLVKIRHTVKMAAIFVVFFIITILPILFIIEIRFFAHVCIDISTMFS